MKLKAEKGLLDPQKASVDHRGQYMLAGREGMESEAGGWHITSVPKKRENGAIKPQGLLLVSHFLQPGSTP